MLKYALYDYYPQRYHRLSFEQQETCRRILDFKDGRSYARQWAAEAIASALAAAELKEVVIVCVPARTFSQVLCASCGAADGFDCIEVIGHRKKAHRGAQRGLLQNVVISSSLQGRKVLLIDDIYTTGTTSDAFIQRLNEVGAVVCGAVFLAKTHWRRTA